ncbi:MAG: hypothetical protein Q8S22_08055, partial [Eubacteriales bacterium]|nr:hypothetical protein [Eubacteriales bacterium]
GETWALLITLAASGAGTNALSGTIPVLVALDMIQSEVGSSGTLSAGGSVGVIADLDNHTFVISGGLAAAGTNAVGATISTVVSLNTVEAIVGQSAAITSGGAGVGISVPNRVAKRRGVIISATANETMVLVAVAASFAGTTAITGVINTLVLRNVIYAKVDTSARITATGDESYSVTEGTETKELSSGDVTVQAEDDSFIINLAGSISASGTVGVGATIVALVFDKHVTAEVNALSVITAGGTLQVLASAKDDLFLLAIAFGAAGTVGVAGGVNALVFSNIVTAALGGTVNADKGVLVSAKTDSLLVNAALAVGGGGTVGVTAIAVVTYFYNQTLAYAKQNANITSALGDIAIRASSSEFVTGNAAGIAVGGTAGVGGTLDILITKVITKAYTESSVKLIANGDILISALDDYSLLAVAVTIGVAGVAGVGLTILLSLSFNTIEAGVGANSILTAGGNVTVAAGSNRNVLTIVTTVGGGGAAGVGVSLSVIVTGNKLPQDAHDSIYPDQTQEQYVNDGKVYFVYLDEDGERLYEYQYNGTSTYYRLSGDVMQQVSYSDEKTPVMTDGDTMDPQKQVDAVFANVDPRASESKPGESLTDLLAGDGQKTTDLDPESSEYGQSDDGSQDTMNDDTYDDTVNNSTVASSRIGELKDATSAVVRAGAQITAQDGNLSVTASDSVNANMIAGTLGVGGYAGVGVGLAVSVLFSNVNALVEGGAVLSAPNGNVTVSAATGSEAKSIENINDDTEAVNDKVTDQISDATTSTVRLISVTGGGGLVGVGITLAALLVFTEVNAVLSGDVAAAKNVTVHADVNFGQVLTGTLAISAGFVGVSVSAGVTYFEASVVSAIANAATLSNISGTINVTTFGITNAIAAAASIAAGAVAVNAGMALTINRTLIHTFIGQGVTIDAPGAAVLVSTDYTANAYAFTISFSVGGVAVGATLALVVSRMDAFTYIGIAPAGLPVAGSSAAVRGIVRASAISVLSDVTNAVNIIGVGVAGGSVAINGIVALGFNRAAGYAAICGANIEAAAVSVTGILSGDTTVTSTALVVGGVAAGATVALAQIKTKNAAVVDVSGARMTIGTLNISAGTSTNPYNSQAIATVVTGKAGGVAIALNFAVAINASENNAQLRGDGGILTATNVSIHAEGNTRAYAIIANASVAGVSVNISVSIALLVSTQQARLTGGANFTLTGSLNVTSRQNTTLQTYSNFLLKITDKLTDTVSGRFSTMAQAYIFSASVGVVSVTANVAVATADATGRAIVNAGDLKVSGSIGVYSYGASTANAKVDNIAFAIASAGLMTGYSYAAGTFEAALITNGTITAGGDVNVVNSVTSDATCDLTPAAAGLQAGAFDLGVNISIAEAKTAAKAWIGGSGLISADDIKVSSSAKVTAFAVVRGVAISVNYVKVALNEAYASVTATQNAYIEDVALHGNSVSVTSSFNDSVTTGAVAQVGSNGAKPDISISFISGTISLAQAIISAKSHAYITGASLAVSGSVSIETKARSYANADILEAQFSVSVISVSLLKTNAQAKGEYTAYLDSTNATHAIGTLSVSTTYYATSYAATGAAGGLGISLVSVSGNIANASNNVSAKSYITGNGSLIASGSVNVLTEGYARSEAVGKTRSFEVSLLKVAVNVVTATLNVDQSAYLNITGSLNILSGSLNVRSEIYSTGDFGKAVASVGGSGAGAQIALVGITANEANAYAVSTNAAYIAGSGSVTAEAISVKAKTVSESNAIAKKSFSVGLLTIGSLSAIAKTGDSVSAYVSGSKLTARNGDVTITALGSTISYAFCEEAGGVGLVSGSSTKAETYVGTSNKKQTVSAGVKSGAVVDATGNVTIRAYNTGSARSVVERGVTVALVAVSLSSLPTKSYYSTSAYVKDGSIVQAGGSISVLSEDYTAATSNATATSIGFGINANYTRGSNEVVVTNSITIGGQLLAGTALTVLATSNADMYAKTYADGGGFFSGDTLKAINKLTRDTIVNINANSVLTADFGNLLIKAVSGADDDIYTYARISSGGVVALGTAKLDVTVDSSATVNIGSGVLIQDRFNTVSIYADASLKNLSASVEVNTSGLGVRPYAQANTDVDLSSGVNITGTSASKAVIEGRYVNIESMIGQLYVYTYTYANGKALGADVDADTNMNVDITSALSMTYASVTGHDKIYIAGSARPAYRTYNIYGIATARLNAIGEGVAAVDIDGTINAKAEINTGVTLIGADIFVTHNDYNGDRTEDKRNTSGFIYKHKSGDNDLNVTGSASVAPSTALHLGDAAGGIYIDISGTENNYTVRQVGNKNESQIWTISGETISFKPISNALPGTARLNASYSNLTIYDQSYLPLVMITNSTALSIVLSGITVQNINFLRPILRDALGWQIAMPSGYTTLNGITLRVSDVTAPSVNVINEQDGGVLVNGLIANSGGSVSFIWTGETGGELKAVQQVTSISAAVNVSPIWTRSLTITNAGSVGAESYTIGETVVEQSFNVYLFNTSGGSSSVNISAQGGIYLRLTAAELVLLDSAAWAGKPWESDDATDGAHIDMLMQSIVSDSGDVIIDLPQGLRAYQLTNTNTLTMPVPGTLEYVTDALQTLSQNVSITGLDALEYYLVSYNPADDIYCFMLPNGTYLYTDALGNVIRITEGGVDFAVSDFTFTTNTTGVVTSIKLAAGVSIDLATGKLTVEDNFSYEVLLSAISGKWLLNNILYSSGSIDLVLSTATAALIDGEPIYTSIDTVVTLSYWWSYGTLTYYYITGIQPSVNADGTYYLIAYDSSSDTFQPYLLKGAGSIISGASSDNVIYNNLLRGEDGSGHQITLNNGITYYELNSASYTGSVIGAAVTRASKVFSVNGLASSGITYNYNSGKWYYGSTELDVKKVGNMFYVPDNFTTTNGTLSSIYDSLKGKYWTVSIQSETRDSCYDGKWTASGDEKFYFAVFAYRKDNTNYYWTNQTRLVTYYLNIAYSTVDPLSLMLVENEDKAANAGTTKPKKDYTLTFGTPVGDANYTATYITYVQKSDGTWQEVSNTVTEPGYASAVLNILGRIDNIPMKAVESVPNNNMVGAVSGYRITDTLYVTTTGIAVMINTLVTIDGKAFAAKFDGNEYHSDYLNATQLGRVSEYNLLAVDEDGNIIYTDGNGYVYRLSGSSFVYTGSKTGVADITGDSAIEIIRSGFFLDATVDGDGYITGYQTAGGADLTKEEALQVFRLGGAGVFCDSDGNLYFFESGQMLC